MAGIATIARRRPTAKLPVLVATATPISPPIRSSAPWGGLTIRSRPKINVKPLATTNSSAAKVSPLRSWKVLISLRRFRSRLEIPVENLFTGHEDYVGLLPDRLEDAAEVFRPVCCTHVVGRDHQRQDARGLGGIRIDLLELVERAILIFRRLVMLDQHHGDVVALLRVGNIDDRRRGGLEPDRLVVEHPVGDIVIAFLLQEVRRLPSLGETGAEPAARTFAGRLLNHIGGLADILALVLDLLHIALGKAVAHEFPVAFLCRIDDRGIRRERRTIDGERGRNLEVVEDLEQAPEADAVAIFVPGPVRDVR